MGLSFSAGSLLSRGQMLTRRISASPVAKLITGGSQISIGNYFRGFLISSVLSAIPSLIWSLTQLWQMFFQAATFVYYFDWNAPDDQLDRQANAQWNAYGSVLGGAVGNTIGWLACGVLPATSMFAFNEGMAAYVLREVGEEAFEEMIFNVRSVIQFTARSLAQQGFYTTYKNVRRWLKSDNNPLLTRIFAQSKGQQIKNAWGEADSESFTFAGEIEERIEQIPSAFWRNFTEELIDEAFDACVEAGYVVASSVDGYLAQQRIAQKMNERTRVVELQPDRSNEREKIILAGPEPQVKSALTQTLAHYQLIEGRDVGQIVGTPVDDYVREQDLSLRLKFQLFSVSSPPYNPNGNNQLVRVTITVPDVKRSALDWVRLKNALGGPNGYLWGRWRATARLGRKEFISVFGATADEAEDRLRAVMQLSNSKIQTLTVTEEVKADERLLNPRLQKEPTRVYPGFVTIINRQRVIAIDQGRVAVNGNFIDKKARFELWRNAPPINFNEDLAEVLRFSN